MNFGFGNFGETLRKSRANPANWSLSGFGDAGRSRFFKAGESRRSARLLTESEARDRAQEASMAGAVQLPQPDKLFMPGADLRFRGQTREADPAVQQNFMKNGPEMLLITAKQYQALEARITKLEREVGLLRGKVRSDNPAPGA